MYVSVGLLNFDNHPGLTLMGSMEPCESFSGHVESVHFHMDSFWRTYVSYVRIGGRDYATSQQWSAKIFSSSGMVLASITPPLLKGQSR